MKQKLQPVEGDWVLQIEDDKKLIDIDLSDDTVSKMSKYKFKKLIGKKVKNAALKYLNSIAEGHSKTRKLKKSELKHTGYVKDIRFSVSEVQLLFKLRTRMYPVKDNFKNKYKDKNMNCELCKIEKCTQEHLLKCKVLNSIVPALNGLTTKYDDLFMDTDKQHSFIKVYSELNQQREILLEAIGVTI